MRAPCILLGIVYYPDPERLIFFHKIGFFMVVVDAGQLFSWWLTLVAPFLKNSFSKFSFLSIKRCILLAECSGKRGGVLHLEGGCEMMPWHS